MDSNQHDNSQTLFEKETEDRINKIAQLIRSNKPIGISIHGLAGTGKTYLLKQLIERGIIPQKDFIFFVYNREKKWALKKELPKKQRSNKESQIWTLHQYVFHFLGNRSKLPEMLQDVYNESKKTILDRFLENAGYHEENIILNKKDEEDHNETKDAKILNENFSKMIKTFNELADNSIKPEFQFKYIIVDEYQDLHPELVTVLQKLSGLNRDTCLIIAGDPYQYIYRFSNKSRRTAMDSYNACFPTLSWTKIKLETVIKRPHPSFQKLINHVIKSQGDICYQNILPESSPSTLEFRAFQTKAKEITFVKELIHKLYGKTKPKKEKCIIVSRNNNELTDYIDICSVSTIHKIKGQEADTVIFVGYHREEEDSDADSLLYVALSRAVSNLFILTSYPVRSCEYINSYSGFDKLNGVTPLKAKDSRQLFISQKPLRIGRTYKFPVQKSKGKILPKRSAEVKWETPVIESIKLSINLSEMPFRNPIYKNPYFDTGYDRSVDMYAGVIDIIHRYSRKWDKNQKKEKIKPKHEHTIDFRNLHHLRSYRYSELQTVRSCKTYAYEFYDKRLDPANTTRIALLNIAIVKIFQNKKQIDEYLDMIKESSPGKRPRIRQSNHGKLTVDKSFGYISPESGKHRLVTICRPGKTQNYATIRPSLINTVYENSSTEINSKNPNCLKINLYLELNETLGKLEGKLESKNHLGSLVNKYLWFRP